MPTITSINAGSPVAVGQSGVVISHTGFSGAITSVTTDKAGVTCVITAGDASSTTVTISTWVDGVEYPVTNTSVLFTCTFGAETASASQTLTKPANYAQVTFWGAITDEQNLIGKNLQDQGHVVEGGTFYYRTGQVTPLTVYPNTSWIADSAGGAFNATFIPLTGATAGNAYLFEVTLNNIIGLGGISIAGLSISGLSSSGLSVTGL